MKKFLELLLGKPRDLQDPKLFHKLSLAAFLAWVGLGADGLSSSAYGPDEAFRVITAHPELAIFVALASAITVFVISLAYTRIIEQFPYGGGGYVVATKLLGPSFGVVSGCALLVDYVLTVTVSIVSAVDQLFSLLPMEYHYLKIFTACVLIVILLILNLRGVKESVMVVVPIFMLFVITHIIVILSFLFMDAPRIPQIAQGMAQGLRADAQSMGLWAMFLLFLNAYSRGAGTYTGIEAVSNGVPLMREPKVKTAQRTMLYMAISLAFTASGILICYLLAGVQVEPGKTLNAVLIERLHFGAWFVILTLLAEGGLLVVAAQTGFIGGPRVLAYMAIDGWLPQRFSALSERLTTHYGILLMGAASLISLFYTKGDISTLVTMYSINVFVTFSLAQAGMCRWWLQNKQQDQPWKSGLALHTFAFVLCFGILVMVVMEKFNAGGWMTLLVTSVLILVCFLIRAHYRRVRKMLQRLSEILLELPPPPEAVQEIPKLDASKPVAVVLVSGYNGLGVHALLAILKLFPNYFKQVIFASAGVIDSGAFKGEHEIGRLESTLQSDLAKYGPVACGFGLASTTRMALGTDPVDTAAEMCQAITKQFPRAIFFGGKLVFARENYVTRMLHNETAFALERRLHWFGAPMIILPVRVNN